MTFRAALVTPFLLMAALGDAIAADPYVGISIGRADYRIDTTGATSADTQDSAVKLFGGAMITPHFGVEASAFNLGEARGSINVPGAGPTTATARVRGVAAFGVAAWPVERFAVFGKLGGAYSRVKLGAVAAGVNVADSESSFQPAFGVGVSYAFDKQLGVRAEWERVRAKFSGTKEDVDLLSVGLSYRF